jgi:hypothetical protein
MSTWIHHVTVVGPSLVGDNFRKNFSDSVGEEVFATENPNCFKIYGKSSGYPNLVGEFIESSKRFPTEVFFVDLWEDSDPTADFDRFVIQNGRVVRVSQSELPSFSMSFYIACYAGKTENTPNSTFKVVATNAEEAKTIAAQFSASILHEITESEVWEERYFRLPKASINKQGEIEFFDPSARICCDETAPEIQF